MSAYRGELENLRRRVAELEDELAERDRDEPETEDAVETPGDDAAHLRRLQRVEKAILSRAGLQLLSIFGVAPLLLAATLMLGSWLPGVTWFGVAAFVVLGAWFGLLEVERRRLKRERSELQRREATTPRVRVAQDEEEVVEVPAEETARGRRARSD